MHQPRAGEQDVKGVESDTRGDGSEYALSEVSVTRDRTAGAFADELVGHAREYQKKNDHDLGDRGGRVRHRCMPLRTNSGCRIPCDLMA
ncbi:hypothetical protein GCM10020295_19940 [Streptomyces cinereospinus]